MTIFDILATELTVMEFYNQPNYDGVEPTSNPIITPERVLGDLDDWYHLSCLVGKHVLEKTSPNFYENRDRDLLIYQIAVERAPQIRNNLPPKYRRAIRHNDTAISARYLISKYEDFSSSVYGVVTVIMGSGKNPDLIYSAVYITEEEGYIALRSLKPTYSAKIPTTDIIYDVNGRKFSFEEGKWSLCRILGSDPLSEPNEYELEVISRLQENYLHLLPLYTGPLTRGGEQFYKLLADDR